MGIVHRIARGGPVQPGVQPQAPYTPAQPVEPGDTVWLRQAFFGGSSAAGKTVTVDQAMRHDAVFACVRVLAESVGALPLEVYQRKAGGGLVKAWFDPTYRLLHDQPNPEMTAMDCWSLAVTHLNTWGNSYLGKEFDASGRVAALWPIFPEFMRVGRHQGEKFYQLYNPETRQFADFTSREIIHIKALSLDGLLGLSPIGYARECIGGAIAQDEYQHAFYANAALPRGVLTTDGELSETSARRLRRQWEEMYRGSGSAHKIAVLDNGAKFQAVSIPLEDAQFIDGQRVSVQKVCRIFRVPPSLVGAAGGEGSLRYSTAELEGIHFERYSVRPWLVRIERCLAADPDLFPGGRSMYPEFDVGSLLRSDQLNRFQSYALALDPDKGWMNRQEVRDMENLPPETQTGPTSTVDPVVSARDTVARILADLEKASPAVNGKGKPVISFDLL